MSKKQSKLSKINVVKPRKVLLLFATPLILVAMIVGGFYIKFQLDVTSAQAGMKEYLQNKYRQEFVVEKPEHKGGGLAVEGSWTANAYKNSDYKFLVHKGRKSYSDTYLSAFYNEQEAGSLRKIISILGIENYRHTTDLSGLQLSALQDSSNPLRSWNVIDQSPSSVSEVKVYYRNKF